jgi:hypothetical protein
MSKSYLLLRTNKQSGPHSLQELLKLQPAAKDLVWVEGYSAGWHYPFELDELKEAVQPPFTVGLSSNKKQFEKQEQPLQIPVIKETSKKIFVSLPSQTKSREVAEVKPSLEEKAEALRQRALNYTPQIEGPKEATEVKYVRSLNDIKEEYADWLHQKKKKKTLSFSAPLTYILLFCVTLAITFFILKEKPQQKASLQKNTVVVKQNEPITVSTSNSKKEVEHVAETITNNAASHIRPNAKPISIVTQKPPLPTPVSVTKIEPQNKIEAQKDIEPINTKEKATVSVAASKESRQPVERATDLPINELLKTSSQYIKTSEGIGLAISLENKSSQTILMVAIDVLYFDKTQAQVAKQTVYFSTILPGVTVTKNSPYQKAAAASYRIGLASSEKSGLYVMQ